MLANFSGGLPQRSEELFSSRKWFHDSSMAVPFYRGHHVILRGGGSFDQINSGPTLARAWTTMQNMPSLDKFDVTA
ncbi:hypothetical protein BGAL_0169g00260 [Botrytis galanthina]|uniref:Uncharacterized protein n=1 Tax=Botrytis galanthina TaxID=278940 RepID=A0A4S8R9M6_9HELO|nr:hypothetical protein BGAL_0169g00260 [Botrytis galanthina]